MSAGRLDHSRDGAAGLGPVSRRHTRFGVAFADFDNDGRLDLYEANGRVARDAPPAPKAPRLRDALQEVVSGWGKRLASRHQRRIGCSLIGGSASASGSGSGVGASAGLSASSLFAA